MAKKIVDKNMRIRLHRKLRRDGLTPKDFMKQTGMPEKQAKHLLYSTQDPNGLTSVSANNYRKAKMWLKQDK